MRLVWDIEYDYDEAYEIGVREGLARWWRSKRKPKRKVAPTFVTDGAVDISPLITMLDPDTSAFETILMRLARSGEQTPKVEWLEDQLFPRFASTALAQLWGEWDWDDSPRKPLTHMTLAQRVPYGTLLRMPKTGKAYRFIGGDTFECS